MQYDTINPEEVEERLSTGESLESILSDSEYQTNWTNHWDVNPYEHGGCFVRYKESSQSFEVLYSDPRTDKIERIHFEISEIWNTEELQQAAETGVEAFEKDPYVGYTSDARQNAEELSNGPMTALDITRTKGGFPMHMMGYYGGYYLNSQSISYDSESEYWETLESHGVNTDQFRD